MAPTLRAVAAAAALFAALAVAAAPATVAAAGNGTRGGAAAATAAATAAAAKPSATPTRTPLPACSGSRCTAYGPSTRCAAAPRGGSPTTCRAFAATNGTCAAIADACVAVACDGDTLVGGSDGSLYCNWCTLTAASCEVGFKLYKVAVPSASPAPVPTKAAKPPAAPTPAAPPVAPPVKAPVAPPVKPPVAPPVKAPAVPAVPAGKPTGRRPRAGPDGCTVLAAGKPARQAFPPYSDEACDIDYTLCEADEDCGVGPAGKRMACVPVPGCAAGRCGRMVVSRGRDQCEGAGRCTRDCRQNVGVCTPVFC